MMKALRFWHHDTSVILSLEKGVTLHATAEPMGLPPTRPRRPLPTALLFGLAGVTGIVDAVCYLGLGHVFTANMTGNVVLLGFALAGVQGLSVSRSATALATFLFGAVLGVRLARSMDPSIPRWPAAALGLEAALLLLSSIVAVRLPLSTSAASNAVYVVIGLTGLAMGIRNATIRRLGEREVNTTVLTMTLTAIGSDSVFAGGSNEGALRRFGFVMSVLGGAAFGALILPISVAMTLGMAAAGSIVCAAVAFGHAATVQDSPESA
jgi:uncharacterized membrane protein YoaK (UPF0700 family)